VGATTVRRAAEAVKGQATRRTCYPRRVGRLADMSPAIRSAAPETFMRSLLALGIALALVSPAAAAPRVPPPELVGLRLGMSDHDVRVRLERLGKLAEMQPEGGERKQIWHLRHKRYGTLNLRLNPALELQWCTAYARRGRLRYADLGDTTVARKVGRFIWVWNVPAAAGRAAYQVMARGTDPVFASSVALSAPLTRPPGAEPPDAPADSIR